LDPRLHLSLEVERICTDYLLDLEPT
jgi:hypothetical protein